MPSNNIAAIMAHRRIKKAARAEENKDTNRARYAAPSAPSIASPVPIDSDALQVPFSPAPTTPAATIQDLHFD